MSDTIAAPETRATADAQSDAGPGKFIWYELMAPDQDAAVKFYGDVVGWTAADQASPDANGARYVIFSAGDRGVGGVLQLSQAMRDGGARPGWVGYIFVTDTDAAAKRIVEAGGAVLMPPQDIPDVGRFAMVADPGGAAFYVMTPLPRDDVPPPAAPGTPGHVSWHELYAGNGEEAAFAFYSGQFGWETMTEMDMGEFGKYRIFGADGVQMGGMMDKPRDMPVPSWGYYFEVDGIDAAIERLVAAGGKVTTDPHEVPGGSWIVQGIDPQGASFALVSERR
jgi:hypothetical protein